MANIQDLEEQLSTLSQEYVKAELWLKLCQKRHERDKAARVHASGETLETARAQYHQSKQYEDSARTIFNRARIQIGNVQHELAGLYMAEPDEEHRVIDEMKASI